LTTPGGEFAAYFTDALFDGKGSRPSFIRELSAINGVLRR
jgi:hypothetical protein